MIVTISAGPQHAPAWCLPPSAAPSLRAPAALAAGAADVAVVVIVVAVLSRPSPAGTCAAACCTTAAAGCSPLHMRIHGVTDCVCWITTYKSRLLDRRLAAYDQFQACLVACTASTNRAKALFDLL